MEDGESLSTALGTNSCIAVVRASISSSLRAKSRRETYFRKYLPNGPNFFRADLVIIVHDAVIWNVGVDFLRFHQRSDPLFRGSVFLLLQELELRVEEESTLFRQVSCRPLDCENVQAPPLSGSPAKETIASKCSCRSPGGPGAPTCASLTCGSNAIPVLLRPCSLIALRAALSPSSSPGRKRTSTSSALEG